MKFVAKFMSKFIDKFLNCKISKNNKCSFAFCLLLAYKKNMCSHPRQCSDSQLRNVKFSIKKNWVIFTNLFVTYAKKYF